MTEHNSFLLYKDNIELLEELSDEEKGLLFQAIYDFACYGIEPDIKDRTVRGRYRTFRNSIARAEAKYQKRCLKNAESADIRWSNDIGITIDTFRAARELGISRDALMQLKKQGQDIQTYIQKIKAVNANACKHIQSNAYSDIDIDSDSEFDRDRESELDNEIDMESVPESGIGRDGSEGKPNLLIDGWTGSQQELNESALELARQGGLMGFRN